jgi:hypothetical protein
MYKIQKYDRRLASNEWMHTVFNEGHTLHKYKAGIKNTYSGIINHSLFIYIVVTD